jgi:osmotically-inducible protein OsmY
MRGSEYGRRRDPAARQNERWRNENVGADRRDFGRENYRRDELGFERRGWRQGSDYYGDSPERFASGRDSFRGGARDEWRDDRYRSEQRGDRGQFNDQWGNAYAPQEYRGSWAASRNDESRNGGSRDDSEDQYSSSSRQMGNARSEDRQEGPYRGRGPRGYRRSDERIREDACECLSEDSYIDASEIDVLVADCEVTLSGTVRTREEKRRAEDLVSQVSGVKDVHNTIRIGRENATQQAGGMDQQSSRH